MSYRHNDLTLSHDSLRLMLFVCKRQDTNCRLSCFYIACVCFISFVLCYAEWSMCKSAPELQMLWYQSINNSYLCQPYRIAFKNTTPHHQVVVIGDPALRTKMSRSLIFRPIEAITKSLPFYQPLNVFQCMELASSLWPSGQLVQGDTKENTKAPNHWSFVKGIHRYSSYPGLVSNNAWSVCTPSRLHHDINAVMETSWRAQRFR